MGQIAIAILCLLVVGLFQSFDSADAFNRRIKRGSQVSANKTTVKKETNLNQIPIEVIKITGNENSRKPDADLKEKLKTALATVHELKHPSGHILHYNQNKTAEQGENMSTEDEPDSNTPADKHGGHHVIDDEVDEDGFETFDPFEADTASGPTVMDNVDIHSLGSIYGRPRVSVLSTCGDKDRLMDLLSGERIYINEPTKHHHRHHDAHDRGHIAKFYMKPKAASKWNLRNDEAKLSSYQSKQPTEKFIKFTKMMFNIKDDKPVRVQGAEIALHPGEKVTKIFYKPIDIDANDLDGQDISDYSTNIIKASEKRLPMHMGYHEYPMPYLPISPFKALESALGAVMTAKKEDSNDGEEYEMTCPVHFNRNSAGALKDGVVKVCSCHLFKKRKRLS